MTENVKSEWGIFYQSLNRLGPQLLEGVHPDLQEWISFEASETDQFWSGGLHADFDYWTDGDRIVSIKKAFETWVHNVKSYLYEFLGPDSLFPFSKYNISETTKSEWILSIDNIRLKLNDEHIRMFNDSVVLEHARLSQKPVLLLQSLVVPYSKSEEGKLIHALSVPWGMIVNHLKKDWNVAFQISYEKWEELIAAAFDHAGYDEVVLTPRSHDHGRDVIAIKKGVGSIRIIDSVKAYKPGNLVKHDDVRALAGVLLGDPKASKGIVTTTSDFAPGIEKDPFISPLIPYRLELMNGKRLRKWLEDIAVS